jgi:hypothetical protein
VLLFILLKLKEGCFKMKKTIYSVISIILVFACVLGFSACKNSNQETGLWADAKYVSNTELGSGEKTLVVEVKAEDKTVTFTIKTDAKTVGEALLENELITGDETEFGLYIKTVNGILADYDVNASYWAFYVDGEYANAGVDSTDITEGVIYRLEYSK